MGESNRFTPGVLLGALVDLVLPVVCGGCGRPGAQWCTRCAAVVADVPRAVTPRVNAGVPVWAQGPYRDPLRGAIVGVKEHGRRDLVEPLGSSLARVLVTLARWGEVPDARRLVLIPAPTRTAAARRRGGDPVEAYCRAAARCMGPDVAVAPVLRTAGWVRDSTGLGAGARHANLRGAITARTEEAPALTGPGAAVVLVDDVITTGATVAESVRVLAAAGIQVDLVVVLAAAD